MEDEFTEEEIEGLKLIFDLFDVDKSGDIAVTELGKVMRAFGQNPTDGELQRMISEYDDDGSGEMSFAEFEKFMHKQIKQRRDNEEIKECFDEFDKNGNGRIGREELELAMAAYGESLSIDEINDVFMEIGGEDCSEITYKDFVDILIFK